MIFDSCLYILIGDRKILGVPHIGMVFCYDDLLNEALSILVLYHGSYLSETWWETAHQSPLTFACEIEQRMVFCTLKAREMDDISNSRISQLMTIGVVHNVLPPITRHVCAKLELNTPVISQELKSLSVRILELEDIVESKTNTLVQLRRKIRSSSLNQVEKEAILDQIQQVREDLNQQQNLLYAYNYRRDQVKNRVRNFENRRLKKMLKYLCDYIYYNFGISHDKYSDFNLNRNLSFMSMRQLHDATEIYVNFHKKIFNYERNDNNIAERCFELERIDDGIEIDDYDKEMPDLEQINVE